MAGAQVVEDGVANGFVVEAVVAEEPGVFADDEGGLQVGSDIIERYPVLRRGARPELGSATLRVGHEMLEGLAKAPGVDRLGSLEHLASVLQVPVDARGFRVSRVQLDARVEREVTAQAQPIELR